MKKVTEKEKYRLWIEYLKESEEYQYYCSWNKAPRKKSQDTSSRTIRERFGDRILEITDLKSTFAPPEKELYETLCGINPEYRRRNGRAATYRFFKKVGRVWPTFGNIHASDYDFDNWWEEFTKKRLYKERVNPSIDRFDDEMCTIFADGLDQCLREVMEDNDRVYTREDIKEMFASWYGETKGRIVLAVSAVYPIDRLEKEFVKIVKEHKKKYKITTSEEQERMNRNIPSVIAGRLASELELYLNVYRLRKNGVKWKEIIQRFSPQYINEDGTMSENGRRLFQGYLSKAKNIIRNAENGLFPGKY